jgi:hypothetical protein
MKKRYSFIFTITAAAVLVSSIAYASKKKLQAKSEHLKQGISEVDLAANLLDTGRALQQKSPKNSFTNKYGDEPLKDLTMMEKSTSPDRAAGR